MCSNGFFSDPIMVLGTEEQKKQWLGPLTGPNAPMTSLATTEPGSGSDAASIVTTAERVDGGYRLGGQKAWISNAGAAQFYVVFAKTDRTQRSGGVSAFLLEKGAEGMTFGEPMKKMGQRAIVCREIFFDNVFVPEENRLGEEGQGFYGLMGTFDISRVVLGAAAVGAARAAYEYALDYAKTRKQFGVPIIEHQAVAFRLADMATRIESARLLVHHAARIIDSGGNAAGHRRHGETDRVRNRHVRHARRGTDARRLGLFPRVPRRAVDARRETGGDRGGHVRHHEARHFPEPGLSSRGCGTRRRLRPAPARVPAHHPHTNTAQPMGGHR